MNLPFLSQMSRRQCLKLTPVGLASPAVLWPSTVPSPASLMFPTQPPDLVREMVGVAHGNTKRVHELVEARPSLAKAAWDWGFGDWETALGAASHMGNREIAEYLIAHGAHPTLFSAAMLGHLDVVKAFVAAQPGVQRISGPHSISPLAHARAGGAAAEPVYRYLQSLGDAGAPPVVPLQEEAMTSLTGTYTFGAGPTEKIDVTVNGGQLFFARKGTMGRGLFHLGDRVFYPAGASAVRIRFAGDGNAKLLTVHDPDLVLTGQAAE